MITKQLIEKIKADIKKHGNVSLCLGKISKGQQLELEKHFRLEKEYFGYISFYSL